MLGDTFDNFEDVRAVAEDRTLIKLRFELSQITAKSFGQASEVLNDTTDDSGVEDDVRSFCLILRIASELVSASSDLFSDGRHYAASALIRQLVEVELSLIHISEPTRPY